MPPKRKAISPVRPPANKKHIGDAQSYDHSRYAERTGIVLREFYPPEMSNERCEQYKNNEIPRPMEVLTSIIQDTKDAREAISTGSCVVHWFKRDLRLTDNRALSLASEKAKHHDIPLICMFLVSPQDYDAHRTSPAKVDFEMRTLEILQNDLAELHIPLYLATVDERKDVPSHVLNRCRDWGAKHVYCNIEYEVDELRRETKLTKMGLDRGVAVTAVHDDAVVTPGALHTGNGKQFSVYSPWLRAWIKHLHENPSILEPSPLPKPNPNDTKKKFSNLFHMAIPSISTNQVLPPEQQQRLSSLWPAGEHEAAQRLERFLDSKIHQYKDSRNSPSANATSKLSVHLAAGTLSARTAVRAAQQVNSTKKLDGGNPGITTWISEVAWRDFYKHVLAHWPYICMSKPFKYEYSEIEWVSDESDSSPSAFTRWCTGTTGFPIVDAAMRQLRHTAYMHNRCRMITASFLAKDLLLDWRRGEAYFSAHLIDADFASNNGGWGFSASCGVDPQPYFRIFNPLLQSEKFDPEGEYIRTWVEELRDVKGKAIHDPYHRGAEKQARAAGYPEMIVDHKVARQRALDTYKRGLGRSTANVGGGVHN